jgi:hypothetical protein
MPRPAHLPVAWQAATPHREEGLRSIPTSLVVEALPNVSDTKTTMDSRLGDHRLVTPIWNPNVAFQSRGVYADLRRLEVQVRPKTRTSHGSNIDSELDVQVSTSS